MTKAGGANSGIDVLRRVTIPPFAVLRAFVAVGRFGGVRRAAAALKLDHAVVSRHLRSLEALSGVHLVDRLHAGGQLTAEGAKYCVRLEAALAEIADATEDLMKTGIRSRLNIWCIPGLASQWLLGRLSHFRAANSDLDIEIHPTDRGPDFAHHEADIDIRFVPTDTAAVLPAGVVGLTLALPLVFPVASPALLERLPRFETVADLMRAPLLHEHNEDEWRAWFQANGEHPSNAQLNGPKLWHAHLTLQAAIRGEGVALANIYLLANELESGRLARVEIGDAVPLGAYTLFARKNRWEVPAVAHFRRWIEKQCAQTQALEPPVRAPVSGPSPHSA